MIERNENTKVVKLFYFVLGIKFSLRRLSETMNGYAFYDIEFNNWVKVDSYSFAILKIPFEYIAVWLQNQQLHDYDYKRRLQYLKQLNKCLRNTEIEEGFLILHSYCPMNVIKRGFLKETKYLR